VSGDSATRDSRGWILRKVSVPDAFFFFMDSTRYTGHFAVSLLDLCDKINRVPVQSVEFHFRRSDLIKWIAHTIGDKELGNRIDQINPAAGEHLKAKMKELIRTRLEELTGSPDRC
jgi:hypothetical protein